MVQNKDKISIFSSHSFKRSPYKDKIISAIQDPINKELLFQVKDYIDFDSIPEKYKSNNKDSVEQDLEHTEDSNNARTTTKDDLSHPNKEVEIKEKSVSEEKREDSDDDKSENSELEDKNRDLTSSTSIKAQTVLNSDYSCEANRLQSEVVLATLNSIDNTSGVYRVTFVASNEVWIYYKDSINLNNVMPNVIDILASSGFYYLEFNRLARTQNAIVFEFDPSNVVVGDGDGETEEK